MLEETGLLPHLNPGVLRREDVRALRPVSASMGLMLETTSERLSKRGGPHFGSPDKLPAARLATLEAAGAEQVPFTTGILIGIGETRAERLEALAAPASKRTWKTMAALDAHGMTAVTALTAQNTLRVESVHPIPPELVRAQIRATVDDIGVDAVKVGMLATAQIVTAVADELAALACPIVVDPVLVATTGGRLLDENALDPLRQRLLPLATVATPNLHEARILAATPTATAAEAAAALFVLGMDAVVVTGGDRDGVDLFRDAHHAVPIEGPLRPVETTHGSGCTHSAALAVHLARGASPLEAAVAARAFAAAAVAHGSPIGHGRGPVDAAAAAAGARSTS